jgi:hypothetical protein
VAGKSKDSHDSRVVKLALVGGESKPTGPNWDWRAYETGVADAFEGGLHLN